MYKISIIYEQKPKSLAEGVTEEQIRDYLKEFLNKYEIPSKHVFVENIPLLGIGKSDKKRIVELFTHTDKQGRRL